MKLITQSLPGKESAFDLLTSIPKIEMMLSLSHWVTLQLQLGRSGSLNLVADCSVLSSGFKTQAIAEISESEIYEQGQAWQFEYASAIRRALDLSAKCKIPLCCRVKPSFSK